MFLKWILSHAFQHCWKPNFTVFVFITMAVAEWNRICSVLFHFIEMPIYIINSKKTGKIWENSQSLYSGVAGRYYVIKSGNKMGTDLNTF